MNIIIYIKEMGISTEKIRKCVTGKRSEVGGSNVIGAVWLRESPYKFN